MNWRVRRPAAEYGVFLRAWAGTVAVRLFLSRMPLRRLRRLVRRALASEVLPPGKRLPAARVARCAARAAQFSPVPSTCLVTALVAESLLRRHGHRARLRVGVLRSPSGAFAAHAWVELDGSVIVGGPLTVVDQYTPLPKIEQLFT